MNSPQNEIGKKNSALYLYVSKIITTFVP